MRDRDDGNGRGRDDERGREQDQRATERAVENKYLLKLDDPRDAFAERRVQDMVDRLAPVAGNGPDQIREAWHLWRAKEPQPETHTVNDPMQARLSDDKNLAFASLLRRAGVQPDRDAPPVPERQDLPRALGDDDIFARAARGSAFKRQPAAQDAENRGVRPNSRPDPAQRAPEPPREVPSPEERPLLRAVVSPLERKLVQAEALEAVARGALNHARERPRNESREDYFKRKYEELRLDPSKVRGVERDLEKLRKVPGLGDPVVAEREFEKADERYRGASNDEERAKAFTRAMALNLLLDANRRDTAPDQLRPAVESSPPRRGEERAEPAPELPNREPDTNPEGQRRKAEAAPEAPPAGIAPAERVDVSDRDIVVEGPSRSYARDSDQDAFRMKDRLRANSEEERLGEAVAHEMFASQRYWDNPELMAEVRAAERRYEANPENADFFVLARQHETLADDAQARDDDELHLADRIALAGLAQRQLYAQRGLEFRTAEDAVIEVRSSPPWERDQVRGEALALMEIEDRGERPFVDDFAFVKRELVRLHEENPDAARVVALLHQYMRHSPALLAEDARWDPAASDRVKAEGDRVLLDDAAATDERLQRELTNLRLALLLDPEEAARTRALARAQEVALLLEVLPSRRSLEIDTGD